MFSADEAKEDDGAESVTEKDLFGETSSDDDLDLGDGDEKAEKKAGGGGGLPGAYAQQLYSRAATAPV